MESKAQILSIKQNLIIVRQKRRKTSSLALMPICSFLIVAILLCMSIESVGINEIASSMCYVYNPVNSLYSDNSSLVFASATLSQSNIDFTVPIVSAKSEVLSNGDMIFEVVNSIMVKSIENGVIEDIGVTNDGVKYIKVMHNVDTYSYIENVDVVGVSIYDKVKKGQEIATARLGEKITLKIMVKGEQLQNIKIQQSKIIWNL